MEVDSLAELEVEFSKQSKGAVTADPVAVAQSVLLDAEVLPVTALDTVSADLTAALASSVSSVSSQPHDGPSKTPLKNDKGRKGDSKSQSKGKYS